MTSILNDVRRPKASQTADGRSGPELLAPTGEVLSSDDQRGRQHDEKPNHHHLRQGGGLNASAAPSNEEEKERAHFQNVLRTFDAYLLHSVSRIYALV